MDSKSRKSPKPPALIETAISKRKRGIRALIEFKWMVSYSGKREREIPGFKMNKMTNSEKKTKKRELVHFESS